MKSLRLMRNFSDDLPLDKVYRAEVSRFAMLPPEVRAENLQDLNQRAAKIEETENVRPAQKMQLYRYKSHLSHAHAVLRKAGK
jgi:hypothetical protein